MAISYEEALETLQAMFTDPWDRETLDAVLRHQKGHMENTVDFILRHTGKDPQTLVDQLQAGINPDDSNTSLDAELARQLSQGQAAPRNRTDANHQQQQQQQRQPQSSSTASRKGGGRGTPTVLPDDFLRVPGRPAAATAAATTTTSKSTMESDAALARMLQDELFSEELSRNPDFAHLARGGRPSNRVNNNNNRTTTRTTAARSNAASPAVNNSPNVVLHKVAEMGDAAKKRLQLLVANFNARNNNSNNNNNAAASHAATAERRGLLDDNDHDDMELAARKDL